MSSNVTLNIGGVVKLGSHVIKSWSTTQATVALSSGEAELYALVKGAAQSLGMISLGADMGYDLEATVYSDSSAAIGISQRKGLGKLRHIKVQMLWIQDSIKRREFAVAKVDGADNESCDNGLRGPWRTRRDGADSSELVLYHCWIGSVG